MLNKICDLEDQIENLNDQTKKIKEKVRNLSILKEKFI